MKKTNAPILISALALSAMALVGCTDEAAMMESESSELVSARQASDRHCTIEVSSQRDGAPAVKRTAEPRCYPSFAEAISATKGAVRLAPDVTPDMFDQHVIGVEYSAPHRDAFWGAMTFTSSVPCTGYTSIWVDEMPWGGTTLSRRRARTRDVSTPGTTSIRTSAELISIASARVAMKWAR